MAPMAIRFLLNGSPVEATDAAPHATLLQWLRGRGMCGTKEGCAEGECGACAVALVVSEPGESGCHFEPVNSCLLPLAAVHGRQVVTVEGVAERGGALHPVQEAMVQAGGSQCGYCTPGFVVSLFCEYYRPGRSAFDPESISGNLCRCTGYRPIAEVAKAMPAPSSTDPRLLQLRTRAKDPAPLAHSSAQGSFYRPTSLAEAWDLFDEHPEATPIAGGTDLLVYANQRFRRWPALISLEGLAELQELRFGEQQLVLGAALPLARLEQQLARHSTGARALEQLLPLFSSRLIRNRATLGGNLGTASPIGDAAPVLLALSAELELVSRAGRRMLPLRDFFKGYRRTDLHKGELIRAIHIPHPLPGFQRFYKVSKRVLDDISTVAGAFALSLDAAGNVARFGVGFGGVAAMPLVATSLERLAQGKPWNESTLALLLSEAETLGTPQSDLRGSAPYRRAMLSKLLEKFFHESQPQAEAAE
jgi:xanthine dehydrogenase small subunit